LIVAVWSKADLDCKTPDGREYFQFDTGMASAFLMLAATARNLEAHPIAGFDPKAAREVLALPNEAQVITLVIMGGHSQEVSPMLTDWQVKAETERKRPVLAISQTGSAWGSIVGTRWMAR
jgi:nitroreductase